MLKIFIMAITSGISMALSWPNYGAAPLLFISLTPLLSIETTLSISGKKYYQCLIFFFPLSALRYGTH